MRACRAAAEPPAAQFIRTPGIKSSRMLTKEENQQALQFLIATGIHMKKRTAAMRGAPELER